MSRSLRLLLLALALALPAPGSADFTEYEDQPDLTPTGAEVDSLPLAQPVPEGGASFLTAFPTGIKLIRGNLDASDIDSYQISVVNGQLLLAAVFDDSGGASFDTVLGVFTGTAPPAALLDDDGARGLLSRLGLNITSTGVRRVAVSGFGDTNFNGTHFEARGGLKPYVLVLGDATNPPALSESEGNNSQGAADPLPKNGGLMGGQLASHDVDYSSINLEVGDRLYVTVFVRRDGLFQVAEMSNHDPVLGLFGPSGSAIAAGRDDDSQSGFAPGFAYTVPAGQAGLYRVALSGFGDSSFNGTHNETPIDYLLMVARSRACPNVVPLISNITTSTGKVYTTANLKGGDHYYTDRNDKQSHVLVDVPESLECAQWIKTANDDKDVVTNPHLTFSVSQDSSVFVAFDSRATADPAWLAAGFTPTPQLIDIRDPNETMEYDVLRRDFKAGTVQLGGNEAPGANSNYVVLALPVDTTDVVHARTFGTQATNGAVGVNVNGVTVTVNVTAGQSGSSVAAALAAAVNADPSLQQQRKFAIPSGSSFVTTGEIQPTQVPLAPPLAFAIGALALAGLAARRLARR